MQKEPYNPALSTERAAEYCNIHTKTLLADVKKGLIPFLKRSESDRGRLRFLLSDLNNYLGNQRTEARQPQVEKEVDWGSI